jgi:hypothetical protein
VIGKPAGNAVVLAAALVFVHGRRKGVTMLGGFILVVALIGFYVASLHFNPWVKCSKCHGKPRPRAWVFSYAHKVCPKCDGTGQQLRFGRRLFRMGPDKRAS